MSETLVEIDHVARVFRRGSPLQLPWRRVAVPVLRDVSLTLAGGEFLGLMGANGAGKTTLLKMVATLLVPDAGRITVGGHDVSESPGLVRRQVGYVLADERSFHWRLSGPANLAFFARLHGIRPTEARRRIRYLLERLDLARADAQPFGQYSSGMKQRLAIARALLHRPRVLLMDEATRSVDTAHAADIWNLVREETAMVDGAVIVVTHHVDEALRTCSRIAILADGGIALHTTAGSMERITSDACGFTVAVRGLDASDLSVLEACDGVREVRVLAQTGAEYVFEVWTHRGAEPIPAVLDAMAGMGGTVSSLERAIPVQGLLERLVADRDSVPADAEVAR